MLRPEFLAMLISTRVATVVAVASVTITLALGVYARRLSSQLADRNASLSAMRQDLESLQSELEKVKHPPTVTLDGAVFIVMRNGTSAKLALVEIRVLSLDATEAALASQRDLASALITSHGEQIVAAKQAWQAAQATEQESFRRHMKTVLSKKSEDAWKASQNMATKAMDAYFALVREYISPREAAAYFTRLPSPERVTKTDADGRFNLQFSRGERVAIAASAERLVSDTTEHYYWLLKYVADQSSSVTLSNDNQVTGNDLDSLIRAPDPADSAIPPAVLAALRQ